MIGLRLNLKWIIDDFHDQISESTIVPIGKFAKIIIQSKKTIEICTLLFWGHI